MQSDLDYPLLERNALDALRLRLGVKARDLPRGMKRAGRRLPKSAHRAAQVISTAVAHGSHPKLSRQIDPKAVLTAQAELHMQLEKIDPKERRKDAILSFLGTQAFNLLLVIALVVGLMYWRGLL